MLILSYFIQILNELLFFFTFRNYIKSKTILYPKECYYRYAIIGIIVIAKFLTSSDIYDTFSLLIYYGYIVFISKQPFLKRTWTYIKFMIGCLSSYLLLKVLIMKIFDITWLRTNPLYDDIKNLFIYLVIYIFCRLIFTPQQKSPKKGSPSMSYYKKLLLALFALPSILLCIAAYLFNASNTSINTSVLIFILIIVSIAIFILLLTMSTNFFVQEQQRHILEQLLQQREMDLAYYEDVSKAMLQVSKLRHDFKNHLILICDYIERQEYTLAIDYIKRITELSHSPVEEVFTNNATISAVLNVKRTKCQSLNIPLKLDFAFPRIYQLEDIHIVAILGNLLDNAITATYKLPVEDRMISLSIRQVSTYIDITCQNSFDGIVSIDNKGSFQSTKTEKKKYHGLGLLNIKDVVEQYSGDITIDYSNNIFAVRILLPNHD